MAGIKTIIRLITEYRYANNHKTLGANINYYYDEPQLGEENLGGIPNSGNGYGYSLDIGLEGQINDKTALSLQAYDVLGRMHWQELPSTQYALEYDANGRPLYNLTGKLGTIDTTQTLTWRIESQLLQTINDDWQVGLHGQANERQSLYQISAQYTYNRKSLPVALTVLVEPQTKALGFAIDSEYVGIKWLADDIRLNDAKRSEISLYGRYKW